MAIYFVGYWNNNLTDAKSKFIPLGVAVRDKKSLVVKIIDEEKIPEDYKPKSELSVEIFKNLRTVFRNITEPASHPTSLYFVEVFPEDRNGSLEEQAQRLFNERVLSYYDKLKK